VEIMQQAVLDFDEAVQVPWRPSFGSTAGPATRLRARPVLTVVRGVDDRPSEAPRPAAATPPVRAVRPAPARPASHRRGRCRPGDVPVRLTRRGRRLLVTVCLAVGLALGALAAPVLGGSSGDLQLAGQSRVVVRSGDTLWSIAASVAGEGDVRVVVDRIEQLNHLQGAAVHPGQVLLLP
jgi:nucleoid-associated protein YgaU